MTAAILAVFSLAGVLNAAADTDTYKDVKRPNGHARSMAAKQADIRACGAVNGFVSNEDFPKTDACMRAHGWVIARVDPGPTTSSSWGLGWGWSGTSSNFAGGISSGGGSSDVSSSSASTSTYDPSADIAASDAANAAAQDMTNAAAAAATQTEVQFNTIYSAGN